MSTFEKLKTLIEYLGIQEGVVVTSDSNFVDDLAFDSLDEIELLMSVEHEFDICIEDEKIDTIATVGDAVEYIDVAMSAAR